MALCYYSLTMKKKALIIGISSIALAAAAVLVGIGPDYHTYKTNSKTINVDDNKIVFTITSYDGKSESKPFVTSLGHAWVSINNNLDHPIKLKDYDIEPNEELTFSAWAISNHFGVIYNLEPEYIKLKGRYDGRKSVSMNIEENQLPTIEKFIDSNDNWTSIKNCSYWSIHLWNQLADNDHQMKTQTLIYTPTRLINSFNEYNVVETNRDFSKAKGMFFYVSDVRTELTLCL